MISNNPLFIRKKFQALMDIPKEESGGEVRSHVAYACRIFSGADGVGSL
jgi:hypothetical protein